MFGLCLADLWLLDDLKVEEVPCKFTSKLQGRVL